MGKSFLFLNLLVLFGFCDDVIFGIESIFSRMTEKHVRELDVMAWEHQLYDAEWVLHAHQWHLEAAAGQLTQMMDHHNIPLRIVPGRIIMRPVEERRDVPSPREPGAALRRCKQLWLEQDPDWNTNDAMRNRLRYCSVPRAWPEWNRGWMAGVMGVAGGDVFVNAEMTALDSGIGIFPYLPGAHSTTVHEAIHTLGCPHGRGLADCSDIDAHVNLVMNGGCPGPKRLGRVAAVHDPEKSYCVDGKCTSLSNGREDSQCAGAIRGKLARQIHVVGVKDCGDGELDWRGYCVTRRNERCSSHSGIGQFSRFDQCMAFLLEKPHKCRSGNIFWQGRNQCRCCSETTEYEEEPGFKIYRSYELDGSTNFNPAITNWKERSKISEPFLPPTFSKVCDDCTCAGDKLQNLGDTFTFDECVIRASQAGRPYMSYKEATGECIVARSCTTSEEFKCEPRQRSGNEVGWSTFSHESAQVVDLEAQWSPCGNNMHCGEVVKEMWLWETPQGHLNPRTTKTLNEHCADFCEGHSFFAVWGNYRRLCACYDDCDRPRNFNRGEQTRHNNVVFERKPNFELGEWGECSVTCGMGIEIREVTCVHPHGCAGPTPPRERPCAREICSDQIGWSCPVKARSPGGYARRSFQSNIPACQAWCVSILEGECEGIIFHKANTRCIILKRDPFDGQQDAPHDTWIVSRGEGLSCEGGADSEAPEAACEDC